MTQGRKVVAFTAWMLLSATFAHTQQPESAQRQSGRAIPRPPKRAIAE